MRVWTKGFSGHKSTQDLPDYITSALTPSSYDYAGAVEQASAYAENCADAISYLLDKLQKKGILDADDILDIVGSSHCMEIKFIEDTEE